MTIHIVQPGESIYTIADTYKVTVERIMQDNGITANQIITGQAIVILYPSDTYIVKQGDSLESIANTYAIPVSQLLRNNNHLFSRTSLIPGETIVISYNNDKGSIDINGYANYLTDRATLDRTFPYLTYLSILGYVFDINGNLIDIDESDIIAKAKAFGVVPLMLISALSLQGKGDVQTVYNFFMNEKAMDNNAKMMTSILKSKGYYGINVSFSFINQYNINLYENYISKLHKSFENENLKIYITLSPSVFSNLLLTLNNTNINTILSKLDGILICDYKYGRNSKAPAPLTSISEYDLLLNKALEYLEADFLNIGCPVMGYGWELPYIEGLTSSITIKLDNVIELARITDADIKFDETSQTPYFNYMNDKDKMSISNIVWFVDARTIQEFLQLTTKYILKGTGTWNIMYYYAPLWSVINSQFKINKILPQP